MTDPKFSNRAAGDGAIPAFETADIEKNKTMAGLAYILFFLPLLACPESPFGKFHANQGLLLLIFAIGGCFILGLLPVLNILLVPLYSLLIMVLAIMGLVNGLGGKAKELPLIGRFRLIK